MIRQIPAVDGIVTAVYDVPPGDVWRFDSVAQLKEACKKAELSCEVIESVPVHEQIKLGGPLAKPYIENYKENLRILGQQGIKCVCYNFMPAFDWVRSDLNFAYPDGSHALAYKHDEILKIDPANQNMSLPGWDASYSKTELKALLNKYKAIDEEKLWKNLEVFLSEIIPVAAENGINMAIHPDDPPWSLFGLPRIITNASAVSRLLKLVDHPANGLTFCTGSFAAAKENNLLDIIKVATGRIHFVHLRNVKRENARDFYETAHLSKCGDIDMYAVLKELIDAGFDGYIRPDHGRMIWGEAKCGGYGLYDRALGASYIAGLVEAILKRRIIDNE